MAQLDVDGELNMDACNFPELLANDLEFSNLIFAAKNLSAGAPSPALGSDEGQWQSSAALASAAPQQHSAVRFQSTEPKTEEKTQFRATQHELSDSESISSGPSFSEVEPASSRQLSVITAATSVTGGRNSVASHKRLSSLGHNTDASWIDLEPDMTAEDDGASIDGVTVPRRLRPSSDIDEGHRGDSPVRAVTANAALRAAPSLFEGLPRSSTRTWSLQMQTIPSTHAERRRSLNHVEMSIPQRRSSLYADTTANSKNFSFLATPDLSSRASFEAPATGVLHQGPASAQAEATSPALDDLNDDIEPWFRYVDQQHVSSAERRRTVHASKRQSHTLPTPPLDEVQSWLDSSLDASQLEDGHRMPLPPDVVETLRVSLACFPETMLLCSSLSTETIRSYAKKVKHPANEPASLHTPPPSPKRWKWSNVLGQRRSVSSLKRDSISQRHSTELNTCTEASTTTACSSSQPPWLRLRNIFPDGSDYLLDALYAHLVAYSYVSGLVPRSNAKHSNRVDRMPSTPDHERHSTESLKSKDSNSNDIPKKAAHLLGLQDAATPPSPHSPQAQRLRKKSSILDTLRGSRSPLSTQSPSIDSRPMKDIQVGLARCIGRLVTTLRVSPGEGAEDETLLLAGEESKLGNIDPLLVRSLCEIVRCCEETAQA
ncbi:26S proteasome regulatory subunit rpn-1 [Verticillium dahliae VDG2]|nr:26S proteasome regulatory subunit rpn-1 [Verticillium dahliae VDG2]